MCLEQEVELIRSVPILSDLAPAERRNPARVERRVSQNDPRQSRRRAAPDLHPCPTPREHYRASWRGRMIAVIRPTSIRRVLGAALCAGALLGGACGTAAAADFSVYPTRIDIARPGRSPAVTVANLDARPLRIHLRLAEWSQDDSGRDIYSDAGRIKAVNGNVVIAPGESRELDVDVAPLPGRRERTYRLFLDEIPDQSESRGDEGNFAVSFALPIFMAPSSPERRAEVEAVTLDKGELKVTVANPGNQHVRIESLAASSGMFRKEIGGWYLLAGARRVHTLPIPVQACRRVSSVEIRIRTETGVLERTFAVDPGMCAR